MNDELWQALDRALTAKATRNATLDRLNQLLRKRFPDFPGGALTEHNCKLSRETLKATELQRFNPGHDRVEPRRMGGPVVVSEYEGERYMFDGTNRLNVWLRDCDDSLHEVTVVKKAVITNDG